MALPGPIQLFGWLTYENFRAVRENRPGVWPQWTHSILIDPKTVVNPTENATTKFTICPDCELSSFLDQVKTYREQHFEQCDRMVPVRGSYWREDLAVKVYSGLDIVNNAPGAGAFYKAPNSNNVPKPQNGKLTRGWRFVPNGCTMTKTSSQLHGSSQNPYVPTCDSIASPTAAMRPPKPAEQDHDTNNSDNNDSNNENNYPRRRILFTGDSQVRTTYNSILSHYRPVDPHQRFPAHSEFLPVLENLNLNNTQTEKPNSAITTPRTESDTEIELVYRADQFLDYLLDSSDEELDKYDTIYLNIGQWPASGPVAGGQWSTAKLLERWEGVIQRLNRWKESREARLVARRQQRYERGSDPDMNMDPKEDPTVGSGESSIVIWAGMNAFPMRTDTSIRVKGDWRTNARLGYWDDWIEIISQEAGGWFRRLNSWQLTFPMLDQVTDKAHFQETDAIDALKLEALYKLDLCSRMSADTPYSDLLSESVTIATSNTTA
ncbi:hypothetical protein BCR41DRAFT_355963 [Lobosporangium transversale]|uniref:Uncharacterized protein n=1 Tax=Lobosporangium transversale TaxID=64571 RepID=A0A1Y2GL33_9FUNG|nr:hypothetical protein BCR41DRAFT_355963 [Lobosporangium transversale]ORZ12956.1 hypothetical protein BCR41DRAFT_355963 [Lobosporangium transversale]|eukprot:XP_021880305.1 hypothetical protein BCR41DRAFT_355963 [Lobosporangium transversale]